MPELTSRSRQTKEVFLEVGGLDLAKAKWFEWSLGLENLQQLSRGLQFKLLVA